MPARLVLSPKRFVIERLSEASWSAESPVGVFEVAEDGAALACLEQPVLGMPSRTRRLQSLFQTVQRGHGGKALRHAGVGFATFKNCGDKLAIL